MKKQLTMATLGVAAMLMTVGCGNKQGFKTTDNGLMYKFEKTNASGQQVQEGDVLVGEMTVRFDTVTIFTNVGHADRILQATQSFDGDLFEGLLMMHVGDKAVFAVDADKMAQFLQDGQMPPYYQKGKGMKIYHEISLQDIVTKDTLLAERANYLREVEERKANEPALIAAYVADNHIKEKARENGLYVIVKKRGNGNKVKEGSIVAVNYTGRLIDGTMFDTSVEGDAIQGEIMQQGRVYEPMKYQVGRQRMIPGWEEGIMGQTEGSILQLVMPSALAYGSQGAAPRIPEYSPLVFDMEIVSVENN